MAAFAAASKETSVTEPTTPARLDFSLILASRSQQRAASTRPTIGFRGRGSQRLQLQQTQMSEQPAETQSEDLSPQSSSDTTASNVPAETPSESVSVLGNTASTTFGNNFNFDREQIQRFIDAQFGIPIGQPGAPGQGTGNDVAATIAAGGPRGPGAVPPGGFAGGRGFVGGRGGFPFGRGGRGFSTTAPRGNLSYQLSDSGLDAAPYAICATPPCQVTKPQYTQNQFTATVGGPLVISHIVKNINTSYTVSYNGSRSHNPADFFSTVPTLPERAGDFSQSKVRNGTNVGNVVQIFDPVTHTQFQNNVVPSSLLNSAALGLSNSFRRRICREMCRTFITRLLRQMIRIV